MAKGPVETRKDQSGTAGGEDGGVASLEPYLRSRLSVRGEEGHVFHEADLPDLLEQAAAAIDRVLSANTAGERWIYLRIPLPQNGAGKFVAGKLVPMLLRIRTNRAVQGWWWMYKRDTCGSALRLRIRWRAGVKFNPKLMQKQCLQELGCEASLLRYEPELRLFGGVTGMQLAHSQFSAESEFLAEWMLENGPKLPTLPEGLSLALILKMLHACGLDSFETWDVFDKVCRQRPAFESHQGLVKIFRQFVGKVIGASADPISQLYRGKNAQLLEGYAAFLETFGTQVSRAHFSGGLECGLREFLVPVILFHWNRVGMPALNQLALAHSAAAEFADLNHKGRGRSVIVGAR